MLYGASYEAQIADRFGGGTVCHVAGKHCESGDIIIRDADLNEPRRGDVLVTPATGAYGHAMANNYNGVPRPPVIFCRDGEARLVVRHRGGRVHRAFRAEGRQLHGLELVAAFAVSRRPPHGRVSHRPRDGSQPRAGARRR